MRIALLLLSTVLVAPALRADCSPKKILRIVTQPDDPSIKPGTFASLPTTFYRLGSKYARVEEALDRENNIHGLIVVNQPDSWMVNKADRTGRHIVDPDPQGKVHVPLTHPNQFGKSFPIELTKIELGCEVEFFESRGSPITTLKTAKGNKIKQKLGLNGWSLVLVRQAESSPPEILFVFHGNDIVYSLRYLSFEELPAEDLTLFAKPADIAFKEE